MKKIVNNQGQTLVEVVVALTAAVVIISAVTITVINSLNNTQYAKAENQASQYAQQGIEMIRNIRDSNLSAFNNFLTGTYCLGKDESLSGRALDVCQEALVCTTPNIDSIYIREICIQKTSSNCTTPTEAVNPVPTPIFSTEIIAKVFWSDGKCPAGNLYCHVVKQISCLSDFNAMPTP